MPLGPQKVAQPPRPHRAQRGEGAGRIGFGQRNKRQAARHRLASTNMETGEVPKHSYLGVFDPLSKNFTWAIVVSHEIAQKSMGIWYTAGLPWLIQDLSLVFDDSNPERSRLHQETLCQVPKVGAHSGNRLAQTVFCKSHYLRKSDVYALHRPFAEIKLSDLCFWKYPLSRRQNT